MACDHAENVQCTASGGQYVTGGGVYTGVMGANNGAGQLGDWNPKLCCGEGSVSKGVWRRYGDVRRSGDVGEKRSLKKEAVMIFLILDTKSQRGNGRSSMKGMKKEGKEMGKRRAKHRRWMVIDRRDGEGDQRKGKVATERVGDA